MGGNDDPLIYYVDPSVPAEWRDYMKAGVESWREAFKGAGLGDKAIKAVLPGDDEWPEDYDAGDIRYVEAPRFYFTMLGLILLTGWGVCG